MMADACPREGSVVRAGRTGEWSDELEAHVVSCASCGEAIRVARWMRELATTAGAGLPPLPDPHLVRLKARIVAGSRPPRRVLLPLGIAGVAAAIGAGAVVASFPREGWDLMRAVLASASAMLSELPDLASPAPFATLGISIAFGLLLVYAVSEA